MLIRRHNAFKTEFTITISNQKQMKKILITAVLFLSAITAFCQEEENGTIYIKHPYIDVVNNANKDYVANNFTTTQNYYSDTANTAAYAIDPYTIADVRASYKFQEEMEVYAYVKNVFDERAPTYMQQNRGIGGIEASMTEPRMFGIGVRGTF